MFQASRPYPNVTAVLTTFSHDSIILLPLLVGFVMNKVARGEVSVVSIVLSMLQINTPFICHAASV
jgi:hypothetical protein